MNNTIKTIFTVLLLAAIIPCIFAQNGIIRELSGDVELKPSGSSSFTAARQGDTVARDTIVSTGFRSTAVIEIGSSLITVRPLTRLSLSEIQSSSDTENVNVSLQTGRVRVDVNPPAGTRTNLTVQSTSASASVRGTSFEFDTFNIRVNEGKVIFGGVSGPPVMVNSGSISFVGTDGTPADPVEVTASSLAPPAPVGSPPPEITSTTSSDGAFGDISIDLDYSR